MDADATPTTAAGNPAVFNVRIDPARNLVHIQSSGVFTPADMKAAANKIEPVLPKLRPGFTLFADFSRVYAMDLDCVPHLTRIMDNFRAREVGLIVRLLPRPDRDIGINLLSLVHYRGRVKTITVDTLAEAERAIG